MVKNILYKKESWSGDSRDGELVNGDGYHYFQMTLDGKILEAFEYYETDDGTEVVNHLPEMVGVHWIHDLGFEDLDDLEHVNEGEFLAVKNIFSDS